MKTTRLIAALLFCALSTLANAGSLNWSLDRSGGSPYKLRIDIDGVWHNFGEISSSGQPLPYFAVTFCSANEWITASSGVPVCAQPAITNLATIATNTVVANSTNGAASPAAFAMPSCDTAAEALQWTTDTGFVCNSSITAASFLGLTGGTSGGVPYFSSGSTLASSAALAANALVIGGGAGVAPSTTTTGAGIITFLGTPSSANLASALTDETGSGLAVFGTSPTLTTPNIVGVTNASNAAAGSVGEYISGQVLGGSAVSLTSGIAADITSISLTAGDWDCSGSGVFAPNAATTVTHELVWISTSSATAPTPPHNGGQAGIVLEAGSITGLAIRQTIGLFRVNISSTTTVYLSARSAFSVSTNSAHGFIGCRRIR